MLGFTSMKIEAVLVCVNYGDVLQHTLPINVNYFDAISVVTHPDDTETISICERFDNVRCVQTTRMHENNKDRFNKGKALNEGIKALSKTDWLVITDADMVFPKQTREVLEKRLTDVEGVYGTTRYMCHTYDSWLKYQKSSGDPLVEWPHQCRRINIGVGFFQAANFNGKIMQDKCGEWYSEGWGHCGRSDRIFWRSWPDDQRHKIKDTFGIHLGDDSFQANWYGRTTDRFG